MTSSSSPPLRIFYPKKAAPHGIELAAMAALGMESPVSLSLNKKGKEDASLRRKWW